MPTDGELEMEGPIPPVAEIFATKLREKYVDCVLTLTRRPSFVPKTIALPSEANEVLGVKPENVPYSGRMHRFEKETPLTIGIAISSSETSDAKEIDRPGIYVEIIVSGAEHILVNVSNVKP